MAKNNLEYKGKNFSISWNLKEKIFFIDTWGMHDKKVAELFMAKFNEFYYKKFSKSRLMLILINCSKLIKTNHEARRLYTAQIKTFLGSAKIAICGANAVIRVVTNFLMATIMKRKNTEVKFFATTEEGLKWLKKI